MRHMNTDLAYIREMYRVPAYKGTRVCACGDVGVIVECKGSYLRIHLDRNPPGHLRFFHPRYRMGYEDPKQPGVFVRRD